MSTFYIIMYLEIFVLYVGSSIIIISQQLSFVFIALGI